MVTVFNEQIKQLIELQKIDSEIFKLKKELAAQPALEKNTQGAFEKKKASLKAAEDELRTLQLRQKEKEIELQTKEDKISKLQGQLYQLKTNKEYSTMELEIKGFKADKSLLEEEILKLLDTVDAARSRCAKEKEFLAAEEKKFKEELDALKKHSAELSGALAERDEKRKVFVPQVEAKLLSQYERILKGREGLALVPVHNNACAGCHLGLPPQVVNEVHMQDKLIVCESCARMLYWPQ
ncbi:MAG: zinc ribbon domain-containing protein [Candidatus Omnitrophota bacterium]